MISAFRYCDRCGADMNKPTPREDLIEGQACPACGYLHFQHMSEREWIIDLWDDLQEFIKHGQSNMANQYADTIRFKPIPTKAEQTVYYFMYGQRWWQGV